MWFIRSWIGLQIKLSNVHKSIFTYLFTDLVHLTTSSGRKREWCTIDCRRHLKILGAEMVTWSKFLTEDPLKLVATVKVYSPLRLGARCLCTLGKLYWKFCWGAERTAEDLRLISYRAEFEPRTFWHGVKFHAKTVSQGQINWMRCVRVFELIPS